MKRRFNLFSIFWVGIGLLIISSCSASRNSKASILPQTNITNEGGSSEWQQGIILLRQGDYRAARQMFIEAYKQNPQDGGTLFYLGLTLELLNQKALALPVYGRFVQLPKTDPFREVLRGRYHWLVRGILETQYREAAEETPEEIVPHRVVVLPFMLRHSAPEWQGLGRAFAALITEDLSQISRLQVVDGLQQQALFHAIGVTENITLSGALVHKIIQAAKSGQVIVGTVVARPEGRIAITATVVHHRKGILPVVSVQGDQSEWFKLQKQLVLHLLKALDVRLTIKERDHLQLLPTRQWGALLAFGRGLTYEDLGDYDLAAFYYEQAFTIDSHFQVARQRLQYAQTLHLVSGQAQQVVQTMQGHKLSRK